MKSRYLLLILASFILAACKSSGDKQAGGENADLQPGKDGRRYVIKSGCVVYKGPMGVKQILYFDNFGAVETFITQVEMGEFSSKETQIRKDGYQYAFKEGETTGIKTKWLANDIDYDKPDREVMERFKVKEIGSENIAGRECRKYSAEFGGAPVTICIWKNIMIKTATKMGNSDMIIEATSIQEGAIAQAIFTLPENVTFKEY
jgi:hypothetical protein